MPKLICKQCEVELVISKTGAHVVEMFSDPPQPYKLWEADGWRCPKCGIVIIAGFADQPLAEHFEHNFDETLNRLKESPTAKSGWLIHDYEWPPIE